MSGSANPGCGIDQLASATTSFTSGTMVRSRFSIPDFSVMVEEGQPEQAP